MRSKIGKPRPSAEEQLSRRERQIMDILYAAGRATGAEILDRLADQPSYSTVRTILRVLERKGHVRHVEENLRYVYLPTMQAAEARQSALERVVRTFFDGSAKLAAAAFLDPKAFSLSKDELNELAQMLEKARKEVK